jgi:hypothetical protein
MVFRTMVILFSVGVNLTVMVRSIMHQWQQSKTMQHSIMRQESYQRLL